MSAGLWTVDKNVFLQAVACSYYLFILMTCIYIFHSETANPLTNVLHRVLEASGYVVLKCWFSPWNWMTLSSDWTAFSQGFWSKTDWDRGSTWDTTSGYRMECTVGLYRNKRVLHMHVTSMPSRALTQASEASQMALRSCPPSRARTTRPPASDISWRVRKPKPSGDKHTTHKHRLSQIMMGQGLLSSY